MPLEALFSLGIDLHKVLSKFHHGKWKISLDGEKYHFPFHHKLIEKQPAIWCWTAFPGSVEWVVTVSVTDPVIQYVKD